MVEVGSAALPAGSVRPVKLLGAIPIIVMAGGVSGKESRWKVIAIDETDCWARELRNLSDLEALSPGTFRGRTRLLIPILRSTATSMHMGISPVYTCTG